ncbi:DUF7344 domain-containing protein [Halorussus ruber]|uniref:DUF7344 domain-containing protein n=1 Tax=Halorussus ruber TaxID=1126238 RepID=UPI001091C23C|nr:hypothetical protein [Halorussus ruber]
MGDDRLDSIQHVLDHPRRRAVVRYLDEKYLPIPVPSFTTYLALRLFPGAEVDDFETYREEVAESLSRDHLPKLDEAGVVDYDPDVADGIIDRGPEFDRAVEFVDAESRTA